MAVESGAVSETGVTVDPGVGVSGELAVTVDTGVGVPGCMVTCPVGCLVGAAKVGEVVVVVGPVGSCDDSVPQADSASRSSRPGRRYRLLIRLDMDRTDKIIACILLFARLTEPLAR